MGKIFLSDADEKQGNLLYNILEFHDKARPKLEPDKKIKRDTYDSLMLFMKGENLALNAFKSEIFSIKPTQGKERPLDLAHIVKVSYYLRLKMLNPKQMLQRLPIALA